MIGEVPMPGVRQRALVRTLSGKLIDLLAPDWRDIDLEDVAWALAGIRRWGANTRRDMVVGEHSLNGALIVARPFRLAMLLHDAHEYVLGDLLRPSVEAIVAACGQTLLQVRDLASVESALWQVRHAIADIKSGLDIAIARRVLEDIGGSAELGLQAEAGVIAGEMRARQVLDADNAMLAIEKAYSWPWIEDGIAPVSPDLSDLFEASLTGPAPSRESVAEEWLERVREEARHRYGVGARP